MSRKLIIYQIMTRLFGNKCAVNKRYGTVAENGVGKFDDISDAALAGIRDLGTTHVWYTGIIEHATGTDYTAFGIARDHENLVKGRAGSPYAIKDYYDTDPDLAVSVPDRMREFENLVERTHRNKLKVIIDFVPNHVARAYHSDARPAGVSDIGEHDDRTVAFARDNNFYYIPGASFVPPLDYQPFGAPYHTTPGQEYHEMPAKATGNNQFTASPGVDDWFETAKLNYGVDIVNNHTRLFSPTPDTWLKMRDILLFWTAKKVDGFRCDMAEMVPVEFWHWVIPQVRQVNPDVIFIAEIYNPSQYRDYVRTGGFNYLYDKVLLYDLLRTLVSGAGSTAEIEHVIRQVADIEPAILRFLENHDEQRVASDFFAGDPWRALPAMVISAAIGTGPVMVYFGQEVGEPALGSAGFQNNDGRTTIFDYWGVPEHQKWMNEGKFDGGRLTAGQKHLRAFYATLLTLVSTNEAIATGTYADLTAYNIAAGNFSPRIHAFLRFCGNERLLILNGFNGGEQDARVAIPAGLWVKMGLDPFGAHILRDLLGNATDVALQNGALLLSVKPYGSYIFKIT